MKLNIFVDSSFIRGSKSDDYEIPLSVENLKGIIDFINKYTLKEKVNLIIPEIVIKELIIQKLETINQQIQLLEVLQKKFKKIFSIDGVDLKKFKKFDFKDYFEKKCNQFIKNNELKIAKIPKININDLIERAINKNPPFKGNSKESDKGFKDSILWYVILEYCKKEKGNTHILLTNDEIFKAKFLKEEFKKYSKNNIEILSDPLGVERFLRDEYDIDIDLDYKIDQIKNKVKEKLGILIEEVYKKNYYINTGLKSSPVKFYHFKHIDFLNIIKLNTIYSITLKLELRAYINKPDFEYPALGGYGSFYKDSLGEVGTTSSSHILFGPKLNYEDYEMPRSGDVVSINFSIEYNEILEEMNIVDLNPSYPLTRNFY